MRRAPAHEPPTVKLYTNLIGPGPHRLTLYLALKGLDAIEIIPVRTTLGEHRRPEFLEKVPAGRLPVLRTEEGVYLAESQAIMQYLEDRFPDPPLRGTAEADRRREDVQAGLITDYYHHVMMMFSHHSPYLARGQPHRSGEWRQAYDVGLVTRPFWWARLEQVAAVMGDDLFLAGSRMTIPDIMLFAHLDYMRALYDMFIPPHNRALYRWFDRVSRVPGVSRLEIDQAHFDHYIARYGNRI